MPRRSPPKQKCLPAPVTTTARTFGSPSHCTAAWSRSLPMSRFNAFEASARLKVTVATWSRTSTSTVLLMSDLREQAGRGPTRPADSGFRCRGRLGQFAHPALEVRDHAPLAIAEVVGEEANRDAVHY